LVEESVEKKESRSFNEKLKDYIKNLLDFSKYDTKTIIYVILFTFLLVISLGLLWYIYFGGGKTFLYRLVVEWFVNPIFNLGIIGIFLFIGIMAIQGLLVPIPSEIVLLATGMIWGWFLGGIMAIIGSMAAGLLCFYISRKGGRPLAKKFVGENAIDTFDELIQKYGMGAIIITRFVPFIPFDVISYTSGLVDMKLKIYAIGTLIGSVFRGFFYAILGSFLFFSENLKLPIDFSKLDITVIERSSEYFNNILIIILVVLVVMFIAYYLYTKHLEKKKATFIKMNK
jgi:uncharacterized membrane protein YdjX (TVP38/TMEM64 family)